MAPAVLAPGAGRVRPPGWPGRGRARPCLDRLEPQAIRHVGADVGEMPHLGVSLLDRDAGIDLPGDGEDPPLVGALLAPALARLGRALDVTEGIVPGVSHRQLSA